MCVFTCIHLSYEPKLQGLRPEITHLVDSWVIKSYKATLKYLSSTPLLCSIDVIMGINPDLNLKAHSVSLTQMLPSRISDSALKPACVFIAFKYPTAARRKPPDKHLPSLCFWQMDFVYPPSRHCQSEEASRSRNINWKVLTRWCEGFAFQKHFEARASLMCRCRNEVLLKPVLWRFLHVLPMSASHDSPRDKCANRFSERVKVPEP